MASLLLSNACERFLIIIIMGFFRKFSLFQFVVNQDNYAIPLPLTFRQSKVHTTIYGGCLSLIHLCVIVIWLGFTAIEMTEPTWIISSWTISGLIDGEVTIDY